MDWIRPMNAPFAKNHMAHLLPAGLGYSDAAQDAGVRRGLGRRIADALAYLVALPRRRAVLDELGSLSDRELADIGIARSELKRVFEPAYARDHAIRSETYRQLGINV
jgi:uncharacterized protein YjiS (DUF1127 family)